MIQLRNKRQRYAWILLSIFVPMLMLASLHVHKQQADVSAECYSCLHHLHHSGHLQTTTFHGDNCVLCHFLSLPYLAATMGVIALMVGLHRQHTFLPVSRPFAQPKGVASLRAPPVKL